MENKSNENLICYCCRSEYTEGESFCSKCGYPFNGTPEEQKKYSINYHVNKIDKDSAVSNVKEAKIVLFALSIFTVIYAVIALVTAEDWVLFSINLILAGIYAGLGFWSRKKPFAAIITGLCIYFSLILLNAVVDPITLFKGIFFKIIFIVALVKAAYGAYKFKIEKN